MQEANRLAEMEYMKSREDMGIPSESVNEVDSVPSHMSPSGKMTTMSPEDDDYKINYGKDAALEETAEVVEGMDEEPGQVPVDEAEMEEELNEIKRITKQLLGE